MAIEDKDKHILIYPFWLGEPEHPNRRDVLCLHTAKPELAWGIGTHDQFIGPETLFGEMFEIVKTQKMNPKLYIQMATKFRDRNNLSPVEQNADKYASVTMNLGWHLWFCC